MNIISWNEKINMVIKNIKRFLVFLIYVAFVLVSNAENAHAYIGPGAGFAFVSSFFILLITILALPKPERQEC